MPLQAMPPPPLPPPQGPPPPTPSARPPTPARDRDRDAGATEELVSARRSSVRSARHSRAAIYVQQQAAYEVDRAATTPSPVSSVAPSVSTSSSRRVPFPESARAAPSAENERPPSSTGHVPSSSFGHAPSSSFGHDAPAFGLEPPSVSAPLEDLTPRAAPGAGTTPTASTYPSVPITPLPDSLLCRTTFNAVEHSATTLKRLTKTVLAASSTVVALHTQLATAEDDLLVALGELGRWLEGGYGVRGDVWDAEGGIRKVTREKRTREREELQVMVEHSVQAVKGEIKRQGLAGAGAQQKFEGVAKQFYAHTATYLGEGTSSAPDPAADLAQAARTAQFDLVRYNHHSTLLYAVPPSSVGCLDLLVGLYAWVGAQLSSVPGRRADTHPQKSTNDFASRLNLGDDTPTQRGRALAVSETPVPILSRDDAGARGNVDVLARDLALSLAHLVQVRGDLLAGWAARDHQTKLLEENARRLADQLPDTSSVRHMPIADEPASTPQPVGKEKGGRRHKIQSAVGGRIRGLFSSSSAASLPTLAERAPPVSSNSIPPPNYRKSMDARLEAASSATPARGVVHVSLPQAAPPVPALPPGAAKPRLPSAPPRPPRRGTTPEPPPLPKAGRHSLQVSQFSYTEPQLSRAKSSHGRSQSTNSAITRARSSALAETTAKLMGTAGGSPSLGGVGGIDGTGDEDDARHEVGRVREGVLWGTGSWEELDKAGGRGRWDRLFVVLAHSNIYEYREASAGKTESAATVIDLKFASVREGRGTDRRFAFEIITPSHGRRLYQATSEAEMKTWIYAICNAIESCINGTATLRASDKPYPTNVLDDYIKAAPPTPKPGFLTKSAKHTSMPASSALRETEAQRVRRTSFKNKLKHSAESAGDRLRPVTRNSLGADMSRPTFFAQGGRMPSYGSTGSASGLVTAPLSGNGGGDTSSVGSHHRSSWYDDDGEIEKRVLEMAGLGAAPGQTGADQETLIDHRQSVDGRARTSAIPPSSAPPAAVGPPASPGPLQQLQELAGAETGVVVDMALLRRIADTGANRRCADCGKGMKSSRWATQSLRDFPMVMFLCIRCCGLHRGLGTHISKPRSVDLDNWTPESILLAREWGNERGNAVWERRKPVGHQATDDDIAAYIQAKYVEGRWLAPGDRAAFGFTPSGAASASTSATPSPQIGRAF